MNTTIAALATAPNPSAIAIIRISGELTKKILTEVTTAHELATNTPRSFQFTSFINPDTQQIVDTGFVVFMPAPKSFTGEDTAELNIHGNPFLANQILEIIYTCGAIPAEPGEFTKRAFLNNKFDLTQVEALGNLINANSERQLNIAKEQLAGKLKDFLDHIGEPLRDLLAELEAHIDFPEEDIEPENAEKIKLKLFDTVNKIKNLLRTYNYGSIIKDGFKVLLCGKPNVGKSSILNLLLRKPKAIVSEISGTTRDLIEEIAVINGYQIVFCDSAGIANSADPVEQIGIELAKAKLDWADLIVNVVDASDANSFDDKLYQLIKSKNKAILIIVNKIDLNQNFKGNCLQNLNAVYMSATKKIGLEQLEHAIIDYIENTKGTVAEAAQIIVNERQKFFLTSSLKSLELALDAFNNNLPIEIISAEIRKALNDLSDIIGVTYNEDILCRIFGKFCIGK